MDELKINVFIGDLFAGDTVIASPMCLLLIDRPANEFCLCESYNLPVQGTLHQPSCTHVPEMSTSHTHSDRKIKSRERKYDTLREKKISLKNRRKCCWCLHGQSNQVHILQNVLLSWDDFRLYCIYNTTARVKPESLCTNEVTQRSRIYNILKNI